MRCPRLALSLIFLLVSPEVSRAQTPLAYCLNQPLTDVVWGTAGGDHATVASGHLIAAEFTAGSQGACVTWEAHYRALVSPGRIFWRYSAPLSSGMSVQSTQTIHSSDAGAALESTLKYEDISDTSIVGAARYGSDPDAAQSLVADYGVRAARSPTIYVPAGRSLVIWSSDYSRQMDFLFNIVEPKAGAGALPLCYIPAPIPCAPL